MISRRDLLKAIGLGALVAPAAAKAAQDAAGLSPGNAPQGEAVHRTTAANAVPLDGSRPAMRAGVFNRATWDAADERRLFAGSHPPAKYECWGPRCNSYGKPHHTPWECSITFQTDPWPKCTDPSCGVTAEHDRHYLPLDPFAEDHRDLDPTVHVAIRRAVHGRRCNLVPAKCPTCVELDMVRRA